MSSIGSPASPRRTSSLAIDTRTSQQPEENIKATPLHAEIQSVLSTVDNTIQSTMNNSSIHLREFNDSDHQHEGAVSHDFNAPLLPIAGSTPLDPDEIRASILRRPHHSVAKPLPFIPNFSPSSTIPSRSPRATPRATPRGSPTQTHRRTRSRKSISWTSMPLRWYFQWRVLKHIITASALPIMLSILAFIYFMLPENQSLVEAIHNGNIPLMKYSFDIEQLDINDVLPGDDQNRTPLHVACFGNVTSSIHWLLNRAPLIDLVDVNGFTPLHYAAYNGNFEIVDRLIRMGAPIDEEDANLRTPLHHSAIQGSSNVAALLIFHGNANLLSLDSDGMRPLDYSRVFHSSKIQHLLDNGYYYDANNQMQIVSSAKYNQMKQQFASGGAPPSSHHRRKKKKNNKKRSGRSNDDIVVESYGEHKATIVATEASEPLDPNIMSLFVGDHDNKKEKATNSPPQPQATTSNSLPNDLQPLDEVLDEDEYER